MAKQSMCGCCTGISLKTPLKVENRAGLSAVSYRIGLHSDFQESLLSKLTKSQFKSLRELTTRENDDFTIALLDSFATMADVITFYQERIANESYLGTAKELLSVTEIARLIGYELNPGVAATTFLSFTLEDKSTQPGEDAARNIKSTGNEKPVITIAKGTKSQSIPEQDEEPQVFETIEEIQAKSDWNSMQVKSFKEQKNLKEADVIYLKGINNNIKKGDQILIAESGSDEIMEKVIKIELLNDLDKTAIYFDKTYEDTYTMPVIQVFPLITYYTQPYMLNTDNVIGMVEENGKSNKTSSSEINSALSIQNWNKYEFKTVINQSSTIKEETRVFVFRNHASLFGYNAPIVTDIDEEGKVITSEDYGFEEKSNWITLDSEYTEITGGEDSYIALKLPDQDFDIYKITKSELAPQSKYGMSAKSTRLKVNGLNWSGKDFSHIRSSTAYIQSEQLYLAKKPISEPLAEGSSDIKLSKFYVDLQVGQKILISGEVVDLAGVNRAEVHTIKEVSLVDKVTEIVTERALENSYVRDTVTINANVALASHGESVNEVLGSGDSAIPFQQFELKHQPLTYKADDSASGSSSTIDIRVNDILWKEVPYIYGQNKDARVYTVTRNREGKTLITFGDGKYGSRLPTGNLNVRATYRQGIGSVGMLKSNQITQLISRPLHLKTVNNPLAPEGAEDPEQTEKARLNANLNIRTLDRIVSLQDYEDFARSFAGVEKAKAVWIWSDKGKVVHVTIAGANGSQIDEDSELLNNLISAVGKASQPGVTVEFSSYKSKYFQVKGNLRVDKDYLFNKVHEEVKLKLKNHYSFQSRDIGQDVYLSEIISVIESMEGVEYVDIDQLFITGGTKKLNKQLIAQVLNSNSNEFKASELIQLDPTPLTFNQL